MKIANTKSLKLHPEVSKYLYNFYKQETISTYQIQKPLEKIFQLAEEILIIGENSLKHWERNKELTNISIINKDLVIRTKEFEYSPLDKEEFKIQIKELKDLGLMKASKSENRSAAFMVRNHAEILREKARMVINYKRLSDNTEDDEYKKYLIRTC